MPDTRKPIGATIEDLRDDNWEKKRQLFEQSHPILRKPDAASGNLPTEGPDNPLDMILRAVTTGMGLEGQKAGDLPSALGAAGSMMIPGAIARVFRRAPLNSDPAALKSLVDELESFRSRPIPGSMAEFAPVTEGIHPQLDPEEASKAAKLTKRKPDGL